MSSVTPKLLWGSVATLLICSFGLVGNVLCFVVLVNRSMRSSPYVYFLQGLAVSDFLLLALSSVRTLSNLHVVDLGTGDVGEWRSRMAEPEVVRNETLDHGDDPGSRDKDLAIATVVFFWDWITTASSKYYAVAVSIERFSVVWFPLKAHRKFTVRRSKVVTLVVLGLCVCLSCFSFAYKVWVHDSSFDIYAAVVLHFLPFTLLILFNVLIFFGLRSHARTRRTLTWTTRTVTNSRNIIGGIVTHEQPIPSPAMATDDSSVTRMLVTVVFLHGLCYSFEFVRRVMNFADPEYMGAREYYEYDINILADVFYVLISSVNFVVYCLLGNKFRSTFLGVWGSVVVAVVGKTAGCWESREEPNDIPGFRDDTSS